MRQKLCHIVYMLETAVEWVWKMAVRVLENQWRFYVGARGHRPPNLAQAPQIFGHSSPATG